MDSKELFGFFKKVVIADRLLVAVKTLIVTPEDYTGLYVLVVMLFYTYQLYADFTGGIDITIGIGESLGIEMAENYKKHIFPDPLKSFGDGGTLPWGHGLKTMFFIRCPLAHGC